MEENNDEWGDVTIPEKVEYEIEEDTPPPAKQAEDAERAFYSGLQVPSS